MKTQTANPAPALAESLPSEEDQPPEQTVAEDQVETAKEVASHQRAWQILISLMAPTMIMPLTGSMTRVALPIIRDDFQISADLTAWVAAAFTLPFMILMPVYGRLSDGVGWRRLLLAGIAIFSAGTVITIYAPGLGWLMVGRAIQGLGISGIMPLSLALISNIFSPRERGNALGTWSSVGPMTGFVGPLLAGLIVATWGWRAAFVPPLLLGLLALGVVAKFVPAGLSTVRSGFLRRFDWTGVLLLAVVSTALLFYLSSRPITGVDPLQDWRLLLITVLSLAGFLWWEGHREDPFIDLKMFRNQVFVRASLSASMRMVTMGAIGFLIPLYLVDIYQASAVVVGGMLMINPGFMALMVRFGGRIADRWGSRWPVMVGFAFQGGVIYTLARLAAGSSLWLVGLLLAWHGLGVGLMLAALHRAAMSTVTEQMMGAAAGLYSMIRFAGVVIGTAVTGVLLQRFLDQAMPTLQAYQAVFMVLLGAAVVGFVIAFTLHEPQAA